MSKKIAIVDDSAPFGLLVTQLLEMEGLFSVDAYTSANDFFKAAYLGNYDLILLDINLPGMDGLSALKKLKTRTTTQAIPVLLLTADGRHNTVVQGVKAGAVDFIVKPIEPHLFLGRVMNILRADSQEGAAE